MATELASPSNTSTPSAPTPLLLLFVDPDPPAPELPSPVSCTAALAGQRLLEPHGLGCTPRCACWSTSDLRCARFPTVSA
eukprot:2023521-Rhodomonas_salina.1